MASVVPQSPFSFCPARNENGETTPAQFFSFLEALVAESFSNHPKNKSRIPASERETWMTLIEGLSENFLRTFPEPTSAVWDALQEKVKLCNVSLDVMNGAATRVEGLFKDSDFRSAAVMMRLYRFMLVIEAWDSNALKSDKYGPSTSRSKAVETICSCIKAFTNNATGESIFYRAVLGSMMKTLKRLLDNHSTTVWPLKFDFLDFSQFSVVESDSLTLNVELQNASQLYVMAADLLQVVTVSSSLDRHNSHFISNSTRELVHLMSQLHNASLSPTELTPFHRIQVLVTLVNCVGLLQPPDATSQRHLSSITSVLLISRLRGEESYIWQPLDEALHSFYGSQRSLEPPVSCLLALELALREIWGAGDHLLIDTSVCAIQGSLEDLNQGHLQKMYSMLEGKDQYLRFKDLREAVGRLISAKPSLPLASGNVLGKRKRSDSDWKQTSQEILRSACFDDIQEWLPDEHLADNDWARELLTSINMKLANLNTRDPQLQLQVFISLKALACVITHPEVSSCPPNVYTIDHLDVSLVSICIDYLGRLRDGSKSKISHSIIGAAYDLLAASLKHHTEDVTEDMVNILGGILSKGLQDQDRSIRLMTGRALVEYVFLSQQIPKGRIANRCLDSAFEIVEGLLSGNRSAIKETTLTILGMIGKMPEPGVLCCVILRLFSQIDQSNILLRGVAYTQLLALAKYHKKSPFALVSPHLHKISMYIVSNQTRRPNALFETCRFLSMSQTDFLSLTLPHTLPHLFATCNSLVLESIHRELSKSISSLFLHISADILAHIFLLKASEDTDKALTFILKTLSEAANNVPIDLSSVVKSCIVPLLGKLVVVMGDDDRDIAQCAMQAICKVEKTLRVSTHRRTLTEQRVGNFLKTYILGIVADLNDIVHGCASDDIKRKVIRGLNGLITEVGSSISAVAPQIMAALQATVTIPALSVAALGTWHSFLSTLNPEDLGSHVGPTTATLVNVWPTLQPEGRRVAKQCIDYIVNDALPDLKQNIDDIADFSQIPELATSAEMLQRLRQGISNKELLERILDRTISDNATVVIRALEELRSFMLSCNDFIRSIASGHIFDPLVGRAMKCLFSVVCRDGPNIEILRPLAFECMGILGAADPDRFDMIFHDSGMIVLSNYTDENEAMQFAMHLVQTSLVGAFRSTNDIQYQSHLAFAIQELLKFCNFIPELAIPGSAVPLKVRSRWNSMPKHVLETVTPLLEAKFAVNNVSAVVNVQHPIYPKQATYRDWLQSWTSFLITRVKEVMAKKIFNVFRLAVRDKDVGVAHQLLPHLVLNILVSGEEEDTCRIRDEVVAILQDQLDLSSSSSSDKRLLSAQAIFMLMDHLNRWIRVVRQELSIKRSESKRSRQNQILHESEMQVVRVDSILASIDPVLIAKAAFECKAYARSLMNFEKQLVAVKSGCTSGVELQDYYDRLHEIYSHLDEPDGMEGISTFILSPSIEHQIRQHESTGRWTQAQSCWEVHLQQSPDKLDYHLGLLRCLRNLGHYDSLRTHIQGILMRKPEWEDALSGYKLEGAWMSGDWNAVQSIVEKSREDTWEMAIARLLLAFRSPDASSFSKEISATRLQLGVPIVAAGEKGYRRAYDAILKLHVVYDLELIQNSVMNLQDCVDGTQRLQDLFPELSSRLDSTLPTFRTREPVLSVHRTAFSMSPLGTSHFRRAVGRAWLDSARIARKASHWQTAYSAILQAQECHAPLTFYQSAKLVRASGEPLRALYELDNALKKMAEIFRATQTNGNIPDEAIQLEVAERKHIEAKARLLRAQWMRQSDRYDDSVIAKELSALAMDLSEFESAHFHAGHFQDRCYKELSSSDKESTRSPRMNLSTIRFFVTSIKLGSKYTYQAIPRLLTLWLDMGENSKLAEHEKFTAIDAEIRKAIVQTPTYKWLTAFPQIISRVDHKNEQVFSTLFLMITTILQEHPQQGLWLFMSVVNSTKSQRSVRGNAVLSHIKNNPISAVTPELVNQAMTMSAELLKLCDYPIKDDSVKTLSMTKDFQSLAKLAPSLLIIPLQESMTVNLPTTSGSAETHRPFPWDLPTITAFNDEIDVMRSLAKPRKITLKGSDGKEYIFLGKPKDDLRKDARLMDFNSIINKLLRTNSESRRRQLRIRTYSVVTLNEECGFIQWVPNTTPVRPILLKYYAAKGIEPWNREMNVNFTKIKEATDREAKRIFEERILNLFPPIFHEWFLDTFPEPTAWLSSRLAYGRTAAVMSIVGFILGLGDRHLENILLDVNSGDVVHVDFNCLFEKGRSLEIPERVPFRLTNNLVDALGVTGVEGVFRNASEITLQLLRDNQDVLMSVLDAFIHDPLVEWEDEKRKLERRARKAGTINAVKESADLRQLARDALTPIGKKLKGLYTKNNSHNGRRDKEISTSNLVQMLIEEATDLRNLAKMYPGWAPWH